MKIFFKKTTFVLAAVLAIASCNGGNQKKEATQKTIDAIVNDENYNKTFCKTKYASHTDTKHDFKADVYFSAESNEQDRFDVIGEGYGIDTNYYGKIDVIFTDSAAVEGVMQIMDNLTSTAYYTAQFTLPDKYTIGSSTINLVYYKIYNPKYVSLPLGNKILDTSLEYVLNDLKEFMSTNGIDIKTFLPNA